ncbi:hypothetical protein BAU15_05290 [Enterococcus sp. JM4C]|uniref:hypothetical protein n=1 Tax=Candidatus Enterococcus huntleyi TaxID=1857217 RepID=UPI0013798124|nr:hypothetical protein [Enterococcus sp. JM4C]KAF1295167.1 hypothetical protein BAU15_05290 [Enterococcus sp. JM4C]
MKAYIIGLESDPDVGNEIVFAKNNKEARKQALGLDLTDTRENYIDVTVRRYSALDNMENSSHRDISLKQWQLGWYFFQDGCPSPPEEHTDEDFYEWYDRVYKK